MSSSMVYSHVRHVYIPSNSSFFDDLLTCYKVIRNVSCRTLRACTLPQSWGCGTLLLGQKWPIIPRCGGCMGGAAHPPHFLQKLKIPIFRNSVTRQKPYCRIVEERAFSRFTLALLHWRSEARHLPKGWIKMSKDEYIVKIIDMLQECSDIELLDLILALLCKSL